MKIEKKLRDFLHLKSTKHFVHCKKVSILRNLADFRYSVKFVSPNKFSTVYDMLNISYIKYYVVTLKERIYSMLHNI